MSVMLNSASTNVERIIAKIDNDFNPDNSDWIPRVGAWCIDAMSQLDVLRTKRKRVKLPVKDKIAYSACPIESDNLKVYDNNGCEIKSSNSNACCNSFPFTGDVASATSDTIAELTPDTIDINNTNQSQTTYAHAETINDKYPYRYNVVHVNNNQIDTERNYVLVSCDKLELNFDTNYIYIETEVIETIASDTFGCELPVIPNNGLLIEAIAYYCIYKMLTRGYKHPVFNLSASQYGTNPYWIWIQLKDEAKRSVIADNVDRLEDSSKLFRSSLFIQDFDPRR